MLRFCKLFISTIGFLSAAVCAGDKFEGIPSDELIYLQGFESFSFKDGVGVRVFKLHEASDCDYENYSEACMNSYEYIAIYRYTDELDVNVKVFKSDMSFDRRFNRAFKDDKGQYCLGFSEKTPKSFFEMKNLDSTEGLSVEPGWVFPLKTMCFTMPKEFNAAE